MSDVNKLGIPFRIACAITGADAQLVAECDGALERRRVFRHAAALALTFSVAACLWGAVLSLLLPRWGAVVGGLFAGSIIYLLDLSISTADWDLKGVLAEPLTASMRSFRLTSARLIKVSLRLALALVLAMVTGTYVTLWLFNGSIEAQLHAQRKAYNEPIEAEYRAAIMHLREDLYGAHQADRRAVIDERSKLLDRISQSKAALVDAEAAATTARVEMHREETGWDGRAAGRGPRYLEAKLRSEAANRRLRRAQQNLNDDQARLAEIEDRIAVIDAAISAADGPYQARAAALKTERNSKRQPADSDFLMRFQALNAIKAESIEVSLVSFATKAVIVIFEMIFFVVFLNDHASVYTVRLIARTKLEARRVDAEFARGMLQIKSTDNLDSGETQQIQAGGQPDGRSLEHCNAVEAPLFEPANQQLSTPDEPEGNPEQNASPTADAKSERHPVIGGDPGKLVTIAEALADRDRYWVNPDRPGEIWDRHHRDQLLDTEYDSAA